MKICKPTIMCPLCRKITKQDEYRSVHEKGEFVISVECFNYIQHAFVIDLEFIIYSTLSKNYNLSKSKNKMGIFYSENNIDLRDADFIMKVYKDIISYTPTVVNFYEIKNNQTKICLLSNNKLNKFLNKYIPIFEKIELLS